MVNVLNTNLKYQPKESMGGLQCRNNVTSDNSIFSEMLSLRDTLLGAKCIEYRAFGAARCTVIFLSPNCPVSGCQAV